MRSWDHLSYGITQCYLPPDRGDSHAFTPAYCWYSFIDPGRMKGWVDLDGWLYQDDLPAQMVTHPSINRARRRVTTLIETNMLPLSWEFYFTTQLIRELLHNSTTLNIRAVPNFGSSRNPALFPNLAEIRLRQKSHRSQIVLPDLKSQFLECWMLDYLDISCLCSTYCLHCCGINYYASACKWCNGNCCTKNNQKLKSLACS